MLASVLTWPAHSQTSVTQNKTKMENNDFVSAHTADHRAFKTPSIQDRVDQLDKVTPEMIQDLAIRYLKKPSLTAVMASEKDLEAQGLPKSSL